MDPDLVLADAPRRDGVPVDHRTGEPLLLERADGQRGWHMSWDQQGQRWLAENQGHGGAPETIDVRATEPVSGQPGGTGRADADVPARPAGTDGPTGARGGHDGGTESPTGHGEVPGRDHPSQAGRDGGDPSGTASDGETHTTDPDAGHVDADGAGSGHDADDSPPRLREDQSLSDLTSDQLNEFTTAVQSRTDRELSAFYDDVYAHLDEAREQGTVRSRNDEKEFLKVELTPAYSSVYNPRTGEFFHATNDSAVSMPMDLDPRLQERIDNMPAAIMDAHREAGGRLGVSCRGLRGERGAEGRPQCQA